MKALFGRKFVENRLNDMAKAFDEKALETLQYMGETFVDKAKSLSTYKDRTGNLRASIGYVILKNGKVAYKSEVSKKAGREAKNIVNEVAQKMSKGFVLIGFAGMSYAAYVEARGYDVITGSKPGSNDLKNLLREIKF